MVPRRRQGQASPEVERARAREALLRRRSDEEWELLLRRLRNEAYVEVRLAPTTPWPLGPVVENLDEVRAHLAGTPHAWMADEDEG